MLFSKNCHFWAFYGFISSILERWEYGELHYNGENLNVDSETDYQ
uniref:Uncharacterized protein n=1 Tax=uncultured Desulfobacterium sp. TaxID=201089 RepID=E1YA62_9BACT|nr:unknown protein [uncultured Desulfobacterium sp.]